MVTKIDNKTGAIVLLPESEPDKRLLYHLLNCADLSQFSEYIEYTGDQSAITTDIGVPAPYITGYLDQTEERSCGRSIGFRV